MMETLEITCTSSSIASLACTASSDCDDDDRIAAPRAHRDLLPFLRAALPAREALVRATVWSESDRSRGGPPVWCFGLGADHRDRALMYARRRIRCTTPHWVISTDRADVYAESAASRSYDCYLGKLRSDRVGREFVLYGAGAREERRELAAATFALEPRRDDDDDDDDDEDLQALQPGEAIVTSSAPSIEARLQRLLVHNYLFYLTFVTEYSSYFIMNII